MNALIQFNDRECHKYERIGSVVLSLHVERLFQKLIQVSQNRGVIHHQRRTGLTRRLTRLFFFIAGEGDHRKMFGVWILF